MLSERLRRGKEPRPRRGSVTPAAANPEVIVGFSDVVRKRRVLRRFVEGGVPRETIERIARLPQRTPSAGFSQASGSSS
jgi:hypothetical protein